MTAELAKPTIDVGIVTDDIDAALAFWRDLLGFPVVGEVSFPGLSITQLRAGDAIIRLCVPDSGPDSGIVRHAESGPFHAETGLRYITLSVRNLRAIAAAAQDAGYPVPVPPREIRTGVFAAQIQDGRGITVELMEKN